VGKYFSVFSSALGIIISFPNALQLDTPTSTREHELAHVSQFASQLNFLWTLNWKRCV
jgi:hypothetical protein